MIINYDHTVIMIVNYDYKTFMVQATGQALGQRQGFLKMFNGVVDLEGCNKLKKSKGRISF
jgi:hypothetical protein